MSGFSKKKKRRTFLDELAVRLIREYGHATEDLTIVFPNRRAGLFFTKALSHQIDRPVWSPAVLSLEDFVYSLMDMNPSDNLSLLLDLYEIFVRETGFKEPFDRFYYWGDMLLRDFSEVDKNLMPVESLFTTLKNLKEIDLEFAFMSEEEKEALEQFWGTALGGNSKHKASFIKFWESLLPVYRSFNQVLKKADRAYPGMIYRQLCHRISDNNFKWEKGKVIFAGFNALLPSEKVIIKWFLESSKGTAIWDLDTYYFDNPQHEAGKFLREYYGDRIFRPTFPKIIPDHFSEEKDIITIASSQYSGQSKIAGDIIHRLSTEYGPEFPENTAVVFPDETLLPQVLYALPDSVERTNITMGYPLKNSAFYSLFDQLLGLQEMARRGKRITWFYYREVLNLLNHHLVSGIAGDRGTEIIREIEKLNMIHVPETLFADDPILREIFDPDAPADLIGYLMDVLVLIRRSSGIFDDEHYIFEKEFSIVFFKLLNRLKELFSERGFTVTPEVLRRVLSNYSLFEKVPFSGEPLEGLQMMGLMETRNLDFDNVIVLCANEGMLPRTGPMNSFLPFNIRRAYGLPNPDTQDAIYSYLFYRLLQRATRVFLIYNTEDSYIRNSEPSRFIHQLKFESGFHIREEWLSMDVAVSRTIPLVIEKDDFVMKRLKRYCEDPAFRLSPSALNTYMACPLNFYYRYLLDISEEDEVSEDLDAAKFGNILHQAMYNLYKPHLGGDLTRDHFKAIKRQVSAVIGGAFAAYYGMRDQGDFQFQGKNILGREIIRNYILKILEKDRAEAPFRILGLEKRYTGNIQLDTAGHSLSVGLKGIIDRIDLKDGTIRIIDYKSGRDESAFKDLESLFNVQDKRRNKAIFQTFFYALLYLQNNPGHSGKPIISGLYNLRELYDPEFDLGIRMKGQGVSGAIDNILPYMDTYENLLRNLITEIFNPDIPFKHREEQADCLYCQSLGMPSELNR